MRFTVPQFLDYEPKIMGPFTFKQFISVGLVAVICLIIYYSAPFPIFLIITIILGIGVLSFNFIKIGNRQLSSVLGGFLKFIITPKMYIWKKGQAPIQTLKKEKKKTIKENPKKEITIGLSKQSQLKKISTHIETKTK